MAQEFSAGIVVFRRTTDGIKYLLLHKQGNQQFRERWDFPKGVIEPHENPEDAAKRETREEAGITELDFDAKFKEKQKYFYKKGEETIFKEVTFFLAETKEENVKISKEHDSYLWAGIDPALKKLKFDNQKEMLEKADAHLNQKTLGEF